jgi:cytochrome c-type biogenesis protein CcsB
MNLPQKISALLLVAVLLAPPLLRAADAAPQPPLDTSALATLAVQDHGRKKPFTTFAYETLLVLAGRSTLPDADAGRDLTPEEVMLDLWFMPEGWDEKPVIGVTALDLKRALGLPLDSDHKLFPYAQLISNQAFLDLLDQAQKARQSPKGADAVTPLEKDAERLGDQLRLFQDCVNGQAQAIVPHPSLAYGRWVPIQNIADSAGSGWTPVPGIDRYYRGDDSRVQRAGADFAAWMDAWRHGGIDRFNQLTPQLVSDLAQLSPTVYPAANTLKFEHDYMTFHPFRKAWIAYLLALLVLLLTVTWGRTGGYRLGWALVLAGLGLEIFGLACRVIISGRPPVTDMYETVIWVSFGAMLFAVILEAVYRQRYFLYAGLSASILALIVADSQPTILDASINPLTAVLRNNMWLTIHVLTIVSSYAAFALTAALGHIALVLSLGGERRRAAFRDVQFFIYRAMQIGVLLLAAGTILGGVWANYSWGRFWDWDPKETWALITLLCYLALLHGRLAGWWSGFGLAVGSVVCFLSVLMSWYGVNFVLGKGLHSYGFGTGGFSYVACFAVLEVVFVAAVLLLNRRAAPVESD